MSMSVPVVVVVVPTVVCVVVDTVTLGPFDALDPVEELDELDELPPPGDGGGVDSGVEAKGFEVAVIITGGTPCGALGLEVELVVVVVVFVPWRDVVVLTDQSRLSSSFFEANSGSETFIEKYKLSKNMT